jgi:hypothetical protein
VPIDWQLVKVPLLDDWSLWQPARNTVHRSRAKTLFMLSLHVPTASEGRSASLAAVQGWFHQSIVTG